MTPLLGYAPNLPVTTPGAMQECAGLVPYEYGMESATQFGTALAGPSTSKAALGFAMIGENKAENRILIGTDDKLYEYNDGTSSWDDVSEVGGYSLASGDRWSFAQFGGTTLAATITEPIQTSTTPLVDFADQATAPNATIIESVYSSGGGFVIAFNTNAGADVWHCSALNDVTSWTPSIATQCATGRLLGASGPIVAAKKFGTDMIVAYKEDSLYVGRYVGGDVVWAWQEYPGYGALGPDAVANLGTAHFVIGKNGFYIFDGVRPIPIGEEVRSTFWTERLSGFNSSYFNLARVVFEKHKNRVWVFVPGLSTPNKTLYALCYHLIAKKWGRYDTELYAATYMEHDDTVSTLSSGMFGLTPTGTTPSCNLAYNIQQVSAASFTTNWFGDDEKVSMLTEARVRHDASTVNSSSVQAYSAAWVSNTAGTTGPAIAASGIPGDSIGRFTLRQTARWHKLAFSFVLPVKVIGFNVKLKQVGGR